MENLFYRAAPRRRMTLDDFRPKPHNFRPGQHIYGDMVVNPDLVDQIAGGPVMLFGRLPYQPAIFNDPDGEWYQATAHAMRFVRSRNMTEVFTYHMQLIMSAIILFFLGLFDTIKQQKHVYQGILVAAIISAGALYVADNRQADIVRLATEVSALKEQVAFQQQEAAIRGLQIEALKATAQTNKDFLDRARADLAQAQADANQVRIDQLNFLAQYNAASVSRGGKTPAQARVVAAELNRQMSLLQSRSPARE